MSTAKSMAASYLSGKRAGKSSTLSAAGASRFKSSNANLAAESASLAAQSRLKSTSMSSLQVEQPAGRLHRPASRSALDSIHKGMNAKYAQVQSKVLLQNIRPQASSPAPRSPTRTRIPAPGKRSVTPSRLGPSAAATKTPGERSVLLNRLRAQQEELERLEAERQALRQELEREKGDKSEQIQQLKLELQEKMQEHDKQNEEYHQKLLEAYELADQNRRAADSVLSESRQRDEEARRRTEELEQQLAELKEFVAMKEEMSNKMFELREQMRQERERYEEQLKSLHQLFENEKLSKTPRSSYFSRPRAHLESCESVNAPATVVSLEQSVGQRHRSEHDLMYGSKLSTRMHDTARSAWKSSKRFASSVITGAGGGLSACRRLGARSARDRQSAEPAARVQQPVQVSVISAQPASCLAPVAAADAEHTSVIQVSGERQSLRIVTKFEESRPKTGAEQQQSLGGTSERSRCESSSSGRGTSSDAGSGDLSCEDGQQQRQQPRVDSSSSSSPMQESALTSPASSCYREEQPKRHRRKSSLFKASRILGGSQASLNKLKIFFVGAPASGDKGAESTLGGGASIEVGGQQLESSRLRCIELNQAIRAPQSAVAGKTSSFAPCGAATSETDGRRHAGVDSAQGGQLNGSTGCEEIIGGANKLAPAKNNNVGEEDSDDSLARDSNVNKDDDGINDLKSAPIASAGKGETNRCRTLEQQQVVVGGVG